MRETVQGTTTMRRMLLALLCALVLVAAPITVPAFGATAIEAEHQRLGGSDGRLGAALHPERCGLPRGGCYQSFEHGSIHWSPATGAEPTWGAIRGAWAAQGWERGKLGYPLHPERCGLPRGGCYQSFEHGSIHWSPATGAEPTWGAIRGAWAAQGWERGKLGYPVGREICGLRDDGCYQAFQGGVMLWSRASGAHPTLGAIRQEWLRHGAEHGALGYPVSSESCSGTTCRQSYQRGSVTWTSGRGTTVSREIDRAGSVFVVVNKRRPLSPVDHVPTDLVDVGGHLVRADAAAAFRSLQEDAAAAGAPMTVVSGYRSYATQSSLYRHYVALYGQAQADLISARPGHSEHQTGLVVDIGTPDGRCGLQACFAQTPAGSWAAAHAHEYGFIVRYPAGHTATTGYTYEPWHLRYVGTHVSRGMVEQAIPTLEHYMGLPAAPTY